MPTPRPKNFIDLYSTFQASLKLPVINWKTDDFEISDEIFSSLKTIVDSKEETGKTNFARLLLAFYYVKQKKFSEILQYLVKIDTSQLPLEQFPFTDTEWLTLIKLRETWGHSDKSRLSFLNKEEQTTFLEKYSARIFEAAENQFKNNQIPAIESDAAQSLSALLNYAPLQNEAIGLLQQIQGQASQIPKEFQELLGITPNEMQPINQLNIETLTKEQALSIDLSVLNSQEINPEILLAILDYHYKNKSSDEEKDKILELYEQLTKSENSTKSHAAFTLSAYYFKENNLPQAYYYFNLISDTSVLSDLNRLKLASPESMEFEPFLQFILLLTHEQKSLDPSIQEYLKPIIEEKLKIFPKELIFENHYPRTNLDSDEIGILTKIILKQFFIKKNKKAWDKEDFHNADLVNELYPEMIINTLFEASEKITDNIAIRNKIQERLRQMMMQIGFPKDISKNLSETQKPQPAKQSSTENRVRPQPPAELPPTPNYEKPSLPEQEIDELLSWLFGNPPEPKNSNDQPKSAEEAFFQFFKNYENDPETIETFLKRFFQSSARNINLICSEAHNHLEQIPTMISLITPHLKKTSAQNLIYGLLEAWFKNAKQNDIQLLPLDKLNDMIKDRHPSSFSQKIVNLIFSNPNYVHAVAADLSSQNSKAYNISSSFTVDFARTLGETHVFTIPQSTPDEIRDSLAILKYAKSRKVQNITKLYYKTIDELIGQLEKTLRRWQYSPEFFAKRTQPKKTKKLLEVLESKKQELTIKQKERLRQLQQKHEKRLTRYKDHQLDEKLNGILSQSTKPKPPSNPTAPAA